MASEAELYCIRKKIPIPRMQSVWKSRLGIEPWAVAEAAEEEWAAIKAGNIPEPDDIDAGWNIMRRAKQKRIYKHGQHILKVKNLKSEIQTLQEELAFAKLPWYRKLNWRIHV